MNSKGLKCQLHKSVCTNICMASGCSSRLVCQICYQSHSGTHLSSFLPVEQFLDESLKKEMLSKAREIEVSANENREEIEKVFVMMEEIVRKELNAVRNKLLEEFSKRFEGQFPTSKQVNTLFKAISVGKTTEEELEYLASLFHKTNSLALPNLEIEADFLNRISEDLKRNIHEIEGAFLFSKRENVDFEKMHLIMEIKAPGKELLSSPFDLKGNMLAIGCADTGLADLYLLENNTPLLGRMQFSGKKILSIKIIPETRNILVSGTSFVNIFKYSFEPNFNLFLEKVYTKHLPEKFIYSVEFLEMHGLVISGGNDKTLRVWNISDLSDNQILNLSSEIGVIKVFEKSFVFVGTKNGEVYFFRVVSQGKLVFQFSQKCHNDWICSLDFNFAKKILATGANDSIVKLWHFEQENFEFKFQKEFLTKGGFVRNVKLIEEAKHVFFVNWTNKASFLSLNTNCETKSIFSNENEIFTAAEFSEEKKYLMLGTSNGLVKVYSW